MLLNILTSCAMLFSIVLYFREQRFSKEADSHSAHQDIPRLLWDGKSHWRVQKSQPLDLSLSPSNIVHILTHYSFKIHFNIIL
jgi:hypothetical protein